MGDGQGMSTTQKVLIALGIVAVGVLAYSLLTTTSEEPPIRVKKGSIILDLVSTGTEQWQQNPSDKTWFISDGENSNEEYGIGLKIEGNPSQCQNVPAKAKIVTVTFSSGVDFRLQHQQKKTKVNAPNGTVKKSPTRIEYPFQGYITKLDFQGGGPGGGCQFADEYGLKSLCLCVGSCGTKCQ